MSNSTAKLSPSHTASCLQNMTRIYVLFILKMPIKYELVHLLLFLFGWVRKPNHIQLSTYKIMNSFLMLTYILCSVKCFHPTRGYLSIIYSIRTALLQIFWTDFKVDTLKISFAWRNGMMKERSEKFQPIKIP